MKAFKLNRRKIEREKSVEAKNELISIAKNPRYASFRILFENRGFYSSQMKQEETKYCDKCNLLRSLPKNKNIYIYFPGSAIHRIIRSYFKWNWHRHQQWNEKCISFVENIQQICVFFFTAIINFFAFGKAGIPCNMSLIQNNEFYLKFHSSPLNHERIYLIRIDSTVRRCTMNARWNMNIEHGTEHLDARFPFRFGKMKSMPNKCYTYLVPSQTKNIINTH